MFKVGERVVCVNDKSIIPNKILFIKKNNIYIISENINDSVKLIEDNIYLYSETRFVSLKAHRRIKLNQLMKCSK